jgi:hypothetical protein
MLSSRTTTVSALLNLAAVFAAGTATVCSPRQILLRLMDAVCIEQRHDLTNVMNVPHQPQWFRHDPIQKI